MTILARILRQCKADLHGVMDQIEDKGLLLKQHLREMECALQEKQGRQSLLNLQCRQITRDFCRQKEALKQLVKELDIAVNKDKDDIAKILIRKRRSLQTCCDALQRRLGLAEEEFMHLNEIISKQQLQYQELQLQVAEYCSLARYDTFGEDCEMLSGPSPGALLCTEEEIELELLQRKEEVKHGGRV